MNAPLQLDAAEAKTLADEEIARRVASGEVELYELLMRRHNTRVYRAIRGYLSDEAEVEDAMQQTYLAAFANLGRFKGEARFSTWLTRIALNEALMRLRKLRPLQPLPSGRDDQELAMSREQTPQRTPEDLAAGRELSALLEETIDELPDSYRVVFVLRHVEELSTAETAEALDVSEEVVKTRLHRARAFLQERLAERAVTEAPRAFAFHAVRCDRVVAGVMGALGR